MPETDLNEVELGVALETLGYGGALEKFNVEWENLLHNILDINVPATAKRKITLTVLVTPNDDRTNAKVVIGCETKYPAPKPMETKIFIGRHKGNPIAVEKDPRQPTFFDAQNEEAKN
jgi:hypothetical protein